MITPERLLAANPIFSHFYVSRRKGKEANLETILSVVNASADQDNPYLAYHKALGGDWLRPAMADPNLLNLKSMARDVAVWFYSWAIPNDEALDAIALHGPIIEIGAGLGYWAHLLAKRGVDVVCFDNFCDNEARKNTWHEIRPGSHEKAAVKDRALFLCWSPYDHPLAHRSLMAYKGDTVIFVGEGQGGCNANGKFFRRLERDWVESVAVDIPQWFGIHDWLRVYKRRQ